MPDADTHTPLYPDRFDATHMDVPDAPNVSFSFVVKAPKAYVMDAWNLPRSHGGDIEPCTAGEATGPSRWPGIADHMERIIYVSGIGVRQVVGNVHTPEDGDWHFEWKAGAPFIKMPFPLSVIMSSVHGRATLSDGPGPNETTVTIENNQRPGVALWLTRLAARAATPTLCSSAPKRFAAGDLLGPQPQTAPSLASGVSRARG